MKESGSALQKVELSIAELDTAASARLKESGSALQKVELSIAKLDIAGSKIKESGSALQQSGRIIAELDTAAVARLKEAEAKIKKASQNLTKLWMWIGVVLVAIVGLWKPRIFLLLVLAIVKIIGLVVLGLCIAYLNIQNIVGLLEPLLLIGLVVTVGVGAVRFVGFKTWPGRKRSVRFRNGIVDLFAIILGQLVGVVIAYILFFQDKEYMIFWLAVMILCAGVMITWYAVFKKQISGIVAIGIAVVGIMISEFSGENLIEEIRRNFSPLSSRIDELKGHTSANHAVLQKLVDSTSVNHAVLQKLVDSTSVNHAVLQKLVDSTSANHAVLQKLVDSTSANHAVLQKLVGHTSNMTDTLTKYLKGIQPDIITQALKDQTDSLTKTLKDQTDSLTKTLKSQKNTIDMIKKELDKTNKELDKANSVRLLTNTEESLNKGGFLNTKRSWGSLFLKKYYNLSKYFSVADSFETVPIGQAHTLGPFKLKRLVSHTGTLKEKKDYTVKSDSIITFINPLLGRMDILAVVERQ